jgi:hypothetical protein
MQYTLIYGEGAEIQTWPVNNHPERHRAFLELFAIMDQVDGLQPLNAFQEHLYERAKGGDAGCAEILLISHAKRNRFRYVNPEGLD